MYLSGIEDGSAEIKGQMHVVLMSTWIKLLLEHITDFQFVLLYTALLH